MNYLVLTCVKVLWSRFKKLIVLNITWIATIMLYFSNHDIQRCEDISADKLYRIRLPAYCSRCSGRHWFSSSRSVDSEVCCLPQSYEVRELARSVFLSAWTVCDKCWRIWPPFSSPTMNKNYSVRTFLWVPALILPWPHFNQISEVICLLKLP